tara:strand:+ start:5330 stop:5665 length:336 start_codon:yes stop_codon:yes gene_type:complete
MPFYTNRINKITLSKEKIEEFLVKRGIEKITFFENYEFSKTNKDAYVVIEHIWSHGDKLYKLAHQYYGDKNSFWLIALFNNKPTDADYRYGDVVLIPVDSRAYYREVINVR